MSESSPNVAIRHHRQKPPEHGGSTTSPFRPIHYLGSKLRITDEIKAVIDHISPAGRVCDLFAGSGTVASALAQGRDVLASDIQEYSRVLCSAMLETASITEDQASEFVANVQNSEAYAELEWATEPLRLEEERCIGLALKGELEPLSELLDAAPIILSEANKRSSVYHESRRRLAYINKEHDPLTVTFRYFGGVYFSFSQAARLTALLIAARSADRKTRNLFLAATLSTASEVANTVGKQFAQPLRIRDKLGAPKEHLIAKIAKERRIDVFQIYIGWLRKYLRFSTARQSHRIIKADFLDTLENHCHDVSVIYADPPYTRDHYSRYYHVLETMCLGDEPQISIVKGFDRPMRGMYRVDRHQSPFCIKSKAPSAFEAMFKKVRGMGVPLVLSYSPLPDSSKPRPRVMTFEDLTALAFRFFKRVECISVTGISHNKLNISKLNSEVSKNAEVLLVCG